ncbi:MAG: Rrf2 family transcriptional regulator [candidate division WOR-3 bacterium]|nr:Rrf2 family transcriptional regulator [candidate division WOR-3 bacterium]MCX7947461.1 Rrf2 family transcriptional regulator [candidate division WOR-3 bacterium]MDW8150620.1 Rrf2 family transcriptional regulator [candidate division WOR-3 bacterium]
MFRLSSKVEYGIRSLIRLYLNGPLTTKELSRIELIPEAFLERIMSELKYAGIIEGKRGPQGGYELVKDIEEIRIIEIIQALEGKPSIVKCVENENSCSFVSLCLMKAFWKKANLEFQEFLSRISLKDIIDELERSS